MDLTALNHEDPILRVLGAAQERIRDPENWCRNSLARTVDGCPADYDDSDAVQWCALGTVCQAVAQLGGLFSSGTAAKRLLRRAAMEQGFSGVVELNNTTDHPTTYAMFDRAQALRMADMMEMAGAAP